MALIQLIFGCIGRILRVINMLAVILRRQLTTKIKRKLNFSFFQTIYSKI
jgi:hypothetical protein